MSDSPPFCTPSAHVGAAQVFSVASQTPLAQSAPRLQASPIVQSCGAPQTAPQSTAVSPSSCKPSAQWAGASHSLVAASQRPLEQSASTAQPSPLGQGKQLPPQSTPVSSKSIVPSEHVADMHSCVIVLHCPSLWPKHENVLPHCVQTFATHGATLAQSVETRQVLPAMQEPHAPPPQSTSVSVPFLNPSLHEGVAQRCVTGLQNPVGQSASLAHGPSPMHWLTAVHCPLPQIAPTPTQTPLAQQPSPH
jgi:hypothetical protein